jgi:cation transport ATPase
MGDGINDAPALMIATAGIAFGKSNSVTSLSAGAVILENSLIKVDELIHISEMTRKIAIGGMGLSVIGMFLAAGGIINPASAALLQEVIDIVAILNALRLTFSKSVTSDIDLKKSPGGINNRDLKN